MAEGASDRTEQATPERMRKAREEGQIAQSEEVGTALIVAMLLAALVLTAGGIYRYFLREFDHGLSMSPSGNMDAATFGSLLAGKLSGAMMAVAPLLVILALVGVFASFISSGWAYSPKALAIKWDRISPIKGVKNLVSLKSIVRLLVSIAKMVVIGLIVWHYLRDQMGLILNLHWTSAQGLLTQMCQLILGAGGRVAVAMLAIAGLDLLYQRWNHRKEMRMSKQEVKEERKQYELAPEIKGRMRAIQIAMVKRRMLKAVPSADVVVTNPTHFAVALKYDRRKMDAPRVVAKGADFLAQTIKEIARKNDVPVIEKPELARALYASAEEGQSIPETLFVAVAEVLAMIYRTSKKAKGTRTEGHRS